MTLKFKACFGRNTTDRAFAFTGLAGLAGAAFLAGSAPVQAQVKAPAAAILVDQSFKAPLNVIIEACATKGVCQINDKTIYNVSISNAENPIDVNPAQVSGTFSYFTSPSDFYQLSLNFNDLPGGGALIKNETPFSIFYNFDVTDPSYEFDQVFLASDAQPAGLPSSGTFVTKNIWKSQADYAAGAATVCSLTSAFSTPAGPCTAIKGLSSIYVQDRFVITGNGVINNASNIYFQTKTSEVPGPLPLLGAGVAFGFSRKLRKRVKTSSASVMG